jgi:hypothetical protein
MDSVFPICAGCGVNRRTEVVTTATTINKGEAADLLCQLRLPLLSQKGGDLIDKRRQAFSERPH